jgi:hypothetical protein
MSRPCLIIPFDSCHPCLYYFYGGACFRAGYYAVLLDCYVTKARLLPKSRRRSRIRTYQAKNKTRGKINHESNSGIEEEEEKETVEFGSDKETPFVEMNKQFGRDVWKIKPLHCLVTHADNLKTTEWAMLSHCRGLVIYSRIVYFS